MYWKSDQHGLGLQSVVGSTYTTLDQFGSTYYLALQSNGGNIGIGTTAPLRQVTLYKALNPEIQFINSGTGVTAGDGTILQQGGDHFYIYNQEAGATIFGTSDTERMRIHSSGAVTFGGTSTLDFSPGVVVNGSTPALGIEADTDNFLTMATTNGSPVDFMYHSGSSLRWITASNAGGTSAAIKMALTSTGLAIGTPSPAGILHLNSDTGGSGTFVAESCQMVMQADLIAVANGSTHTIEIVGTSSLFFIQQNASGTGYNSALFFGNYAVNGATVLLADPAGQFSHTAGTSSKTNVYISGYNNNVIVQNNSGYAKSYTFQVLAMTGQ
jgi:hypothetical protein